MNGIKTSVEAPNMNAIAEPFIGSIRREALDYFLIISEKQILNVLWEYIDYYNSKRPHQGLYHAFPKDIYPSTMERYKKIIPSVVFVIIMKRMLHDG